MRAALIRAAVLMAIMLTTGAESAERHLKPVPFESLAGWREDALGEALVAFRRSCTEISAEGRGFNRDVLYGGTREDWLPVCRLARKARAVEARAFFEANFLPAAVADSGRPQGLFTGYFEPEARGSRARSGPYQVPLYRKPADLVAFDAAARAKTGLSYGRLVEGSPQGYLTRREIEEGALAGQGLELLWLTDWADAFFMQVQGSGRVRLEDESLIRLAYAAKTGLPYTAIGGLLVERGEIPREEMSMQSIRAWMAKNPKDARALMWANQSFVFFREVEVKDPHLGPPGAQKVELTPNRSLAVDRGFWAFGTPVWLDIAYPSPPAGELKPMRQLLIAQDTGTAIKGRVRGDVFWGAGDEAAFIAGHMKSPGRMTVLLPHTLARRLGLAHP